MKKLLAGVAILLSVFTLTSCSKEEEKPKEEPPIENPGTQDPDNDNEDQGEEDQDPGEEDQDPDNEPETPESDNVFEGITFELKGDLVIDLEEGMYYKNEYPKINYPEGTEKNFYAEYKYEVNGVVSKSIDTTVIGEHKVLYTITYKADKTKVWKKTKDLNITARVDKGIPNPENITTNDVRILNRIEITSSDDLEDAIKVAKPGDALILKDGTYGDLNTKVEVNGTQENPIFIMAENPGNVIFTGETSINTKGAYIVIAGLDFEGDIQYNSGIMKIEGNYNRISNIKMLNLNWNENDEETGFVGKHSWIQIGGKYNEVDHSHFEGKNSHGVLMVIARVDGKEDHHYIHHNYFKDFTNPTTLTNEFELIRIGTSGESRGNSFTRIEYNILDNISAEAENISVKAGGNTIKGNYIINSASSITLRHGTDSIVEDNIIIGKNTPDSGGIRIYDEGHIIRNNYIESIDAGTSAFRGGIVIHAGNNDIDKTTADNGQWTPRNIKIYNNTIVNTTQAFVFENQNDRKYGPSHITFKNNLVVNSGEGKAVLYQDTDVTYLDTLTFENNEFYATNIIEGTDILAGITEGLITSTDIPTLTDDNGIKVLRDDIGAKDLEILTKDSIVRS